MTNEREQALLHVIEHGGRVSQTMYHDMQARAEAAEKRVQEQALQILTLDGQAQEALDRLATATALLREARQMIGDNLAHYKNSRCYTITLDIDAFLSDGR